MKAIPFSGSSALIVSLLLTRWAIPKFSSCGLGQLIREDGPAAHHLERGAPTMGGAAVVVSVLVGYGVAKLSMRDAPARSGLLVLFLLVGMAGVGFIDASSRSGCSAASVCAAGPSCWGRRPSA